MVIYLFGEELFEGKQIKVVFGNTGRRDRLEFYYGGMFAPDGYGHDDHVKLISALNPTYYMPIHGEFHMMVHSAEIAEKIVGIKRENIFVCDNGDVLEISANGARKTGRVQVGGIMYDDSGAIVSEVVLKDRIHMSTEGIFVVVLTVQRGTGRLLTSPDIISRGFIYLRDSEELMGSIRQYLKQKVAFSFANKHVDLDVIKKELKEEISHILYDQTRRTPIVIPVINEIGGGGNINAGNSNNPNNPNKNRQVNNAHRPNDQPDFAKPVVPRTFQLPKQIDTDDIEPKTGRDYRGY